MWLKRILANFLRSIFRATGDNVRDRTISQFFCCFWAALFLFFLYNMIEHGVSRFLVQIGIRITCYANLISVIRMTCNLARARNNWRLRFFYFLFSSSICVKYVVFMCVLSSSYGTREKLKRMQNNSDIRYLCSACGWVQQWIQFFFCSFCSPQCLIYPSEHMLPMQNCGISHLILYFSRLLTASWKNSGPKLSWLCAGAVWVITKNS